MPIFEQFIIVKGILNKHLKEGAKLGGIDCQNVLLFLPQVHQNILLNHLWLMESVIFSPGD